MDGMNNRWFPGDGRDVPLPQDKRMNEQFVNNDI